MIEATKDNTKPGDVLQISPNAPVNDALHVCFMVAEDIKDWGVQGYVTVPGQGLAYVRVPWEHLAWIGSSYWVATDAIDKLDGPDTIP